jgi:hypothetical protein
VPKDGAADKAPAPDAKSDAREGGRRVRQLFRCGNCGYVLSGAKAEKACPACGAAPSGGAAPIAFEGRPGEKRARLLRLRLHPMAAHAAPAFSAALLALAAAIGAVGAAPIGTALVDTARVLAASLPFAIAAAFLTGLADGRLRLKRGTTPLLVRKMIASAVFLAFSFASAALALFTPLDQAVLVPFGVLGALSTACALYLGRKGAGLRDAAVAD